MGIRFGTAVAAAALSLAIGASAQASLVGATVQAASYFEVSYPPLAASPTECTIIDCNILDYEGSGGPTNSPLPMVPVTYLEDNLTLTTVSVGDTQITITNDSPGQFGTPGSFSGYVFMFTGAPDITNVTYSDTGSGNFVPVPIDPGLPTGLTWTNNTITLNVGGDSLSNDDTLTLDVTTGGSGPPAIPEPSTWAMVLLGFAGVGFAGGRRRAAQTT
jgi:PEP-CTERM motif